ncbi:MAG: serine/threonine-protein kinase [Candidatus Poribacteria bacterium]|nr:serine/threonine-protein kinase [Candidatus Poribacteria bacterium]
MQLDGLVLGKYWIETLINSGSFASVFRAKEQLTNRIVAIKTLSKSSYPPGRMRYLLTELSAMGLNWGHPNIVSIHTVEPGDDNYIAYIIMEHVDGPSLRELMNEKPITPNRAISIALDVCRGLTAAHEFNIIHRDIKPQNILLTSNLTAKISDFGVARILETANEYAGTITGTRKYMSPEQYEGNYDHRADLYSTGLTLYEMLTGRSPFRGANHNEIQAKKRSAAFDIAGVPNDFHDILLKALHPDVNGRYRSAAEMYGDLDQIRRKWYAAAARSAISSYSNADILSAALSKNREELRLSTEAAENIESKILREGQVEFEEKKRIECENEVDKHYDLAIENLRSDSPQIALQEMQQAHRLYLANAHAAKKADAIFHELSEHISNILPTKARALIQSINELPANEKGELKEWFFTQFPPSESDDPSSLNSQSTDNRPLPHETGDARPGNDPSPEYILKERHEEIQNAHELEATQICQSAEEFARQRKTRRARSEYKKLGEFYRKQADSFITSGDWESASECYARSRLAYMAARRITNARQSAGEAGFHFAEAAALHERKQNWAEAGNLYLQSAEQFEFSEQSESADESWLRATICYFNVAEDARTAGKLKQAYDFCEKTLAIAKDMRRPTNAANGARKLIREIEELFLG